MLKEPKGARWLEYRASGGMIREEGRGQTPDNPQEGSTRVAPCPTIGDSLCSSMRVCEAELSRESPWRRPAWPSVELMTGFPSSQRANQLDSKLSKCLWSPLSSHPHLVLLTPPSQHQGAQRMAAKEQACPPCPALGVRSANTSVPSPCGER